MYILFKNSQWTDNTEELVKTITDGINGGETQIHLLLATCNGSFDSNIAIYSYLRSLPANVGLTTYNTATLEAMGTIIYLSGDRRIALPYSSFVFQEPSETIDTNGTLYASNLKALTLRLEQQQTDIQHIIYARCQQDVRQRRTDMTRLISEELTFGENLVSAYESVKLGISDEVAKQAFNFDQDEEMTLIQ